MFARLLRRDGDIRQRVARLYVDLVEQARRPEFYSECGVPDSVMGRYDMIVIHAFLVFRRLQQDDGSHDAFAQALFDHLFADIDQNLRELGVGDLGVGKKVKQLAQGFYGRVVAYERGLADLDGDVLDGALRRNLYDEADPSREQLAAMADYLRRETAALRAQPVEGILAGAIRFGPPPTTSDGTR